MKVFHKHKLKKMGEWDGYEAYDRYELFGCRCGERWIKRQ